MDLEMITSEETIKIIMDLEMIILEETIRITRINKIHQSLNK